MTGVTERLIELEGQRCLCLSKPDEADEDPQGSSLVHSFDQGQSWWDSMLAAFEYAKKAGTLVSVTDAPDGPQEDIQAFIVSLLQQVRRLEIGEALKIMRLEGKIIITREEVALVARASILDDVIELEGRS